MILIRENCKQRSFYTFRNQNLSLNYMYESNMHGSRIVLFFLFVFFFGGGGAPPDLCGSNLGGSSLRPGVFLEKSDGLFSYCFRT